MASITSNREAVIRALSGLAQAMNFRRRPGGYRTLGDTIARTTAETIIERTVGRQQTPSGAPLAKLKPSTVSRKRRLGLDPRILVATHKMMEYHQVLGRVVVTRNVVVMSAGLDEDVRQKVAWATEGSVKRKRKKRPFYELGADGEKEVGAVLNEAREMAVLEAERV